MYGIIKLLLKKECNVEDTVLIESPFEEETRLGVYCDTVILAITPNKFVIAAENNAECKKERFTEDDPNIENFSLVSVYPLTSIQIAVFKRTHRQSLKVVFNGVFADSYWPQVPERWKIWKQKFEIYTEANKLDDFPETRKVAIFLNLLGDQVSNSYRQHRRSSTTGRSRSQSQGMSRNNNYHRQDKSPSTNYHRQDRNSSNTHTGTCTRCGQIHRFRCPAKGVTCRICKRKNHYEKCCYFNKNVDMIFWQLWCRHVKEIRRNSSRWPYEMSKSAISRAQNTQRWTDKDLYMGSKRQIEDLNRPIPIPGIGRTGDQLFYLKPQYSGCCDRTEHWAQSAQCNEEVQATRDYENLAYTDVPNSNITYTSLMTTVGIIGQF
ncbi:uncharacterized protein LOC134741786 [Cydia strobilella]|uniref:uncharacterized protein LOC134741786 n=1 Tax=Cydia strobilella TaxID=1100964 RepID=UPI00300473D7